MSGFILQNFSKNKKLPFGKKIFIYFLKPDRYTEGDIFIDNDKMDFAGLLIKIGFFKDIEDYERQGRLYRLEKGIENVVPYQTQILGIDDPSTGRANIQDLDTITIQDNITTPLPIDPPHLDYGRKRSTKRKTRKRGSKRSSKNSTKRKLRKRGSKRSSKRKTRKRGSKRKTKRKSRKRRSKSSSKRKSRKQYKKRKSFFRRKFKYETDRSKYPKTEKFYNCVAELRKKSKHKRWPKSGSKRESMYRPIRNACLKKLNLKKSK
jgi:hypothetical protein